MHNSSAVNNKISNLKITNQWVLILCVVAIFLLPIVVHAGNQTVQDKVSSDLAKLTSFNQTSSEIANRPAIGFLTIGADANCDLDSAVHGIQTLLGKGVIEIRVASNGVYNENLLIHDKSVVIRGGFVDCDAADANNQTASDLTVIDGSSSVAPVIRMTGNNNRNVVRLENLWLTGGTSGVAGVGGGLSLDETDLELQMLRVAVVENSGAAGTGMFVNNGLGINTADIDIFAQDVMIFGNQSTSAAAGIFCLGAADVTFTGISAVANNIAENSAGIKMQNSCEISFYTEFFPDSLIPFPGIYNNLSENEAGGALITLGAQLFLFGQRMCAGDECIGSNIVPILVANNHADDDNVGNEDGGGLYLAESSGLSEVYANGLIMDGNTAGGNGGGAYVGVNTKLTIERQSGGCWEKDRCNLIIANQSGTNIGLGGGIYVEGGELDLSQSYIEENRADFGTAISASGESAMVLIESSVFDDNGDEGSDGYSDFQVIDASLGAAIDIRHSTFTDNHATNTVFNIDPAFNSSLSLLSSIVFDTNSGNLFSGASGTLSVNCLVAHESNSYSGFNVEVNDPLFLNPSVGDFHLAPNSPAIDLCEEVSMLHPLDMDSEPRGWDDPVHDNEHGTFDAGADESYLNDIIFIDGFETI